MTERKEITKHLATVVDIQSHKFQEMLKRTMPSGKSCL